MTGYKVIQYRCGCEFIFILDPAKAIFKKGKCPEHWTNQETVMSWCIDCGAKTVDVPQAGHRRQRCKKCGYKHQLAVTRHAWKTKYRNRYYKSKKIKYNPQETDKQKAVRVVGEIVEKIKNKFAPPGGYVPLKNN